MQWSIKVESVTQGGSSGCDGRRVTGQNVIPELQFPAAGGVFEFMDNQQPAVFLSVGYGTL